MFDRRAVHVRLQPATGAATAQAASPAARCAPGVTEEQHVSKTQEVDHARQRHEQRPQQEQQRQHAATGFARWSRTRRAKADTFGYILSLVFHLVTLSKYKTLPASHNVYYSAYTVATACLLVWQRSGRPSYAAWRDWVQAAIRLDVFLSPARVVLWQHSLDGPPPGLSFLAALPVLFSNTLAVHLLMLPFAHTLGLWPHLVVQAISVSKVMFEVLNQHACQRAVFQHPATQTVVEEAYWGLKNLRAFSFRPIFVLPSLGSNPYEQHCMRVILWLVVMVGFVTSIAAQAWVDGAMFGAFVQEQQQRQQQQQQIGWEQQQGFQLQLPSRQGLLFDSVIDRLTGRYLLQVVHASKTSIFWLLLSAAVWDALAR